MASRSIRFTATLKKFSTQGEKTGWTYFELPVDLSEELKPGNRKGYRVKGKIDNHKISGVSTIPMGGGILIIPVNVGMRKAIGKKAGSMIEVYLQEDLSPFVFNRDFMDCLGDEPAAAAFFETLSGSHQRYFSKWIDDAKTIETKTKRIARAVNALSKKLGYGEMLRAKE